MIHDLTVQFCDAWVSRFSRTTDQMIQAARSGKQNIVEGVGQSKTSKKGEIKLLGVANASFEELITDYEDFLRQHGMATWPKYHPKVQAFRKRAAVLSSLSNLSPLGDLKIRPRLPSDPETAANLLLTLCHMATYVLFRQIEKAENDFVEHGGFSEHLFNKRLSRKMHQ